MGKITKVKNTVESNLELLQDTIHLINTQQKMIMDNLDVRNTKFGDTESIEYEQILSKANYDDMSLLDKLIAKKLDIVKVAQNLLPKTTATKTEEINTTDLLKAIREQKKSS